MNIPNRPNPLILTVDDDRTLQMMLKVAIEKEGFEVVQASSGEQCLQDCHRLAPDMILLDAMMPGIDGFECCRKIRQIPHIRQIPILMITVLDKPEFVDQAFLAGASDFVTKPIHWAVLSHRVQGLIEAANHKRRSEQALAQLDRYRHWKKHQYQCWQKVQGLDLHAFLLGTLQNLREFLTCDRILLYQSDNQTWLEAFAPEKNPSDSSASKFSLTTSVPLKLLTPELWTLAIENFFPNPAVCNIGEFTETAREDLCRQLQTPSVQLYAVVIGQAIQAVLVICNPSTSTSWLDLEIEAIQNTLYEIAIALHFHP